MATARVRKLTLLNSDMKPKGYDHAHIHSFTPVLEKGKLDFDSIH